MTPPAFELRQLTELPVWWLDLVPIGTLEVGLAGLGFRVRSRRRVVPIALGLRALKLPLGATIGRPKDVTWRRPHPTVKMAQRLATSRGFRDHLDVRPHPERMVRRCAEGASFAALWRDRVVELDPQRATWDALVGNDLPPGDEPRFDHRLDLLWTAMLWLDDAGFDNAIKRHFYASNPRSCDRDALRHGMVVSGGYVALGGDSAPLALDPSPLEQIVLNRWLRQS